MDIPMLTLKGKIRIPQIGLGTWKLTGSNCVRTVSRAIELGYRHIDTAEAYDNEEEIGQAIASCDVQRSDLFLTSKVWPNHADQVSLRRSLMLSLGRLKTSYLDLYLLHWPTHETPVEETIRALAELRDQGLIRAFGVSNFGPENLDRALKTNRYLAVNQVEFHPFLYQKELLALCKKHEIVLTAYSPIARGTVLGNKTLKEIGKAHGKNEAQVALRWILDKDVVVIPKASNPKNLEANIDLDFRLTKKETALIDALNEDKRLVDPKFSDWS